ncbi:hypothetical protein EDB81DRAFT_869038 [Dactylonectria macrodidyma]|uniref:Uncharacterized protein n=1 Tax=Dactylonectria macrodidyma TaxID=307937 RepID=A0A9P9EVI1_9HYPO|nr:hypothetical protein EDB81DRAFT_869038 [Dactylonectria macrodidyma]
MTSYHPTPGLAPAYDISDFDEYRHYLPGQWCPIVTIIGSVPSPSDNTSNPSEPRRFTVETSVYDASKASPVPFSQKVRTPSPRALLSITAKVASRTTNTNQLALREGRATPSTPSKRQRVSEGASDVAEPSYGNPTSQEVTRGRLHLPHTADSAKASPNPPSPLTIANIADAKESSITLAPSPSLDSGTRPHRSRHPPRKYTDRE